MTYDVVIAGGGPAGLLLGCELGLAGVRAVVLERLAEPDLTIKAGAITLPAAEAFYRRGMLPSIAAAQGRALEHLRQLRERAAGAAAGGAGVAGSAGRTSGADRARAAGGPPADAGKGPPKFAGHFAGLMLRADLLDGAAAERAAADLGPVAGVSMVSQQEVERILAERAAELGIEVRRGVEVTGLEQDADGVTVTAGGERLRAEWLVGCDGGRSVVRKLAGFDFPGTDPQITGHQAIVEMTGAEALRPGWNWTGAGVYVHGPVPGRILTVEFDGPPAERDAPVTAAELEASVRAVSGVDVTITKVLSATRFTDNARQATTYRMGRVLLAGDAAHVHSPFGGQGLNLGLGDAMNLGWKLAATVRGWAPEGLLDSYTAERHPIGAWVLDWTRAQVALMRPGPGTAALRAVVGDLAGTAAGAGYFIGRIAGGWHRYPMPGEHPLVGLSAPDLALSDGSRLADHLRDGEAVLVQLTGAEPAAAAGYRDGRLQVVTAGCPDRPELAALLVRPDGFVAWAADRAGGDEVGLESALARWLGAPAVALQR